MGENGQILKDEDKFFFIRHGEFARAANPCR